MSISASQNPYRVERVHALGYQLEHETWDQWIDRLRKHQWRGAIVGPHGSGKTTLLVELGKQLRARGENVVELFTNTEQGRRLPKAWDQALRAADAQSIVLADGYEVLHAYARWRIRHRAPRLIVTAHRRCALATLQTCKAEPGVVAWLVKQLSGQMMTPQIAEALLRQHQGNMREVVRSLYDAAAQD